MADNVKFPFGLRPVDKDNKWVEEAIDPTYADLLYKGDRVVRVGSGTIEKASLADGALCCGVIVGFLCPNGGTENHYPGTAEGWKAMVCNDPMQVYEAQEDSDTVTLNTSAIGSNALIVAGTPNDNAGLSGDMLDSSSAGTAGTEGYPIKIIGFSHNVDNVAGNNYGVWKVILNNHELSGGKAGV